MYQISERTIDNSEANERQMMPLKATFF